MFGRSKRNEAPDEVVERRYVVEAYAPFGGPMKHHDKYAAGLEAKLNEGNANGWALIALESGPAAGLKMLVWDTKPQEDANTP